MKSGVELIADERRRQIDKEGWTYEHDDGHTDGSIAMAAAVYAMTPTERANEILRQNFAQLLWPWDWTRTRLGRRLDRGRDRQTATLEALAH
jgi:hypothetical protein